MSSRKKIQGQGQPDLSLIEVKSKFEAEFRRFALRREQLKTYDEFYKFLQSVHCLEKLLFSIYYRDPHHGDLLPINNTENFLHALQTAVPLLRLFVQRGDMPDPVVRRNPSTASGGAAVVNKRLQISVPQDFRRVSAIIDVDILPDSIRRVRLCKHNSDKPLGFYIRDGTSIRITTDGLEKVPGIFVSRLVPGGLAESTGLLSVNDEVLEVNGIEVSGKSIDQVTEMMVANSQNLIVTVKPVYAGTQHQKGIGPDHRASTGAKGPSPLATANGSGVIPNNQPLEAIDSDEEDAPRVSSDGVVHV